VVAGTAADVRFAFVVVGAEVFVVLGVVQDVHGGGVERGHVRV
jgi:hypothetical protein